MHANEIQFPVEFIPMPLRPAKRRIILRAVQSPESCAEPGATDAALESSEPNLLITLAHELAAVTGLVLWLGGCIVAASMVV